MFLKKKKNMDRDSLQRGSGFIALILCLLILSSLVFYVTATASTETISVAFTNDLHGFLLPFEEEGISKGGMTRISSLLNGIREENKNVLYLDAGDVITGSGTKYKKEDWSKYLPHKSYRGLLSLDVMNEVGLDAMVLGNHEFDYGLKWLEKLQEKAEFDILSANAEYQPLPDIEEKEGNLIAPPFEYYSFGDVTLGVIGLTTHEYIQSAQVSMETPEEVLEEILPSIKDEVDFVIVLSHLGIGNDKELAEEVEGIDVIIGAHSHDTLFSPVKAGDTRIVSSGSYGRYLGTLDLVFEEKAVTDIEYELIPVTEEIDPDPKVVKLIEKDLTVVELDRTLESADDQQSSLGTLITDSMLWYSGADVALFSSGTYQGELEKGEIEALEFFEVFWPEAPRGGAGKDLTEEQLVFLMKKYKDQRPFEAVVSASDALETLTVLELKGKELEEIIEQNKEKKGDYAYLQIGADSDLKKENSETYNLDHSESYEVALNLGLALRKRLLGGEFEQLWKPDDLEFYDSEVFEVVLKYLRDQ